MYEIHDTKITYTVIFSKQLLRDGEWLCLFAIHKAKVTISRFGGNTFCMPATFFYLFKQKSHRHGPFFNRNDTFEVKSVPK